MKIITFWCAKGGVGKSTMAKNFGAYLSQYKSASVLLIDKDTQRDVYHDFKDRQDSPFTVTDEIPSTFDGFDYVICDMPPLFENAENPLSVNQLRLIEHSDLIVVPFTPNNTTVKSALATLEANTDATFRLVLNQFRGRSKRYKEALEKVPNCLILPRRDRAYEELEELTLFDKQPYSGSLSDARNDFRKLARQLLESLDE
jgi:cellulose biosynthesis protein BcsQ